MSRCHLKIALKQCNYDSLRGQKETRVGRGSQEMAVF